MLSLCLCSHHDQLCLLKCFRLSDKRAAPPLGVPPQHSQWRRRRQPVWAAVSCATGSRSGAVSGSSLALPLAAHPTRRPSNSNRTSRHGHQGDPLRTLALRSASWALASALRRPSTGLCSCMSRRIRLSARFWPGPVSLAPTPNCATFRVTVVSMLRLQRQLVTSVRSGFRPLQPIARGLDEPLPNFPVSLPCPSVLLFPGPQSALRWPPRSSPHSARWRSLLLIQATLPRLSSF